jgi:hypothetical protein
VSIRIPIRLIIEMSDEQEAQFARFANLGDHAKDMVAAAVRSCVVGVLTDDVPFGKRANGTGGASVSTSGKENDGQA